MYYPKILLVSDLILSLSDSKKFANPTLYNLFKNYPPESILQYIPVSTLKTHPPSTNHHQLLTYKSHYISLIRNRIGLYINPLIEYFNLSLIGYSTFHEEEKVRRFNADIILICPITLSCLITAQKISKQLKIPFLIYFMDDWLAKNNTFWFGGNVQKLGYKILKDARAWVMISEFLQQEMSTRYQIYDKPCVIAHNPVNSSLASVPKARDKASTAFQVAYAGSIQPMHEDAFLLVAESIYKLRKEGENIELILYTSSSFWERYKHLLSDFEVINGNLVPYHQLQETLSNSDLLLVCTSFNSEYEYPVRSSLLTKLTDYMASGKPILSCGPEYSACNKFLKQWDCGVICSSNQIIHIQACLRWCMSQRDSISHLAETALDVLSENFSESVVQHRLYKFISAVAQGQNNIQSDQNT